MRSLSLRLYGIGFLSLVAILVLVGFSLSILHEQLIAARVDQVRTLSETTRDIAKGFHDRASAGELDQAQAMTLAKATIRGLRYSGNEYFSVYDNKGTALVVPPKPEWEGQNKADLTDPNGVPFIRMLIERASTGGGSLSYSFPRLGSDQPVEKIAYAVAFPDWNWIITTGVYIDDIEAVFRQAVLIYVVVVVIGCGLVAAFAIATARDLSRAIARLMTSALQIQRGDYTSAVPGTDRRDEIGRLALSIRDLRDEAATAQTLRTEQEAAKAQNAAERRAGMLHLADQFEASIAGVAHAIAEAVEQAGTAATSMFGLAKSAEADAGAVSQASAEVSANLQTVAAATEELSASINEISQQVAGSSETARTAVNSAHNAGDMISGLTSAVGKIGDVVSLITNIAAQTNLLALNATIEAARAGDAGKGFAVVAGEVKSLANQTSVATGEIETQIKAVQDATQQVVGAIGEIAEIIDQISATSTAIASAVEEQTAATGEISRTVTEAAGNAANVSRFVDNLVRVTGDVGTSAGLVDQTSTTLRAGSANLQREVDAFLHTIRA